MIWFWFASNMSPQSLRHYFRNQNLSKIVILLLFIENKSSKKLDCNDCQEQYIFKTFFCAVWFWFMSSTTVGTLAFKNSKSSLFKRYPCLDLADPISEKLTFYHFFNTTFLVSGLIATKTFSQTWSHYMQFPVSFLGVESLPPFCAWLFQVLKNWTLLYYFGPIQSLQK